MNSPVANRLVSLLAGELDVPATAYDAAARRYKDVAEWFGRPESRCAHFSPHVYAQGSFRLGTVLRPISADASYDLDLGCRLREGISKAKHTQKQLKDLVGAELQAYRDARGIKERVEEKHRCWRLRYADTLNFHMDAVPSIPELVQNRQQIREAMVRGGAASELAAKVAALTGSITDNRLSNYQVVSDAWRISNAEGFALWFESRMLQARSFLEARALAARATKIDDLPANQWKTPLQACVQLLKRHRDVMFAKRSEQQPISIIITTLAGLAYQGESEVAVALDSILARMGSFVSPTKPRIPNPVNPAEDFADKWGELPYAHLQLERNFWHWLETAKSDLQLSCRSDDPRLILEGAKRALAATLSTDAIARGTAVGMPGSLLAPAAAPAALSFPPKPIIPTKPAGFA